MSLRKPFVSLVSNDRYQIGCTGQTVYLLDAAGNELAKFQDMSYAYYPALHPDGDIAAVYSNKGIMAIYSLSERRLVRKFRVTAVNDTQTNVIPRFSPDGAYLYHIEGRKGDALSSRISVYSTVDYRPVKRLFEQAPRMRFSCMDFDESSGYLYLLGYFLRENRNDYFVAPLNGQSLQNIRSIDQSHHDFYRDAIFLKQQGFTKESYKWSSFAFAPRVNAFIEHLTGRSVAAGPFGQEYTLDDLKLMDLSLARLWEDGPRPKER